MKVKEHNLYLETHGPLDGPVVILLHHGLGSTRAWRAQIPALVAAGLHVVVYDRWGYGASDARTGLSLPYFEEDLADLLCLLDLLRLDKVSLVGHSDGGTIALYIAAQYHGRVTRLVTIAAHIYIENKMQSGIESVHLRYESDPIFREGLRRLHGEKVEAVFDNWYNGWVKPENLAWDMRPSLGKIVCPALVIQGTEDEHATPQHARDLAEAISKAELWLVPGAGHMLPQERPEEFNSKIVNFIKGVCAEAK